MNFLVCFIIHTFFTQVTLSSSIVTKEPALREKKESAEHPETPAQTEQTDPEDRTGSRVTAGVRAPSVHPDLTEIPVNPVTPD